LCYYILLWLSRRPLCNASLDIVEAYELYPDHTQPAFEWMERELMRRWRVNTAICS
jgi:hypothetical protein